MFRSLVCGGLSAFPLCCFSPPYFALLTGCLWFFKLNKYINSHLSQLPLPSENLPSFRLTSPLPQSVLASFHPALLFALSIVLFPKSSHTAFFREYFPPKETKQSRGKIIMKVKMQQWLSGSCPPGGSRWTDKLPCHTCFPGEQHVS